MALCVVDPVDTELAHVLWLIAPEELDVAGSTPVALSFFKSFDVLQAEVALVALGGVNALVGLKLPADILVGNSLVVSRRGAAVGVWWGAAPGELVEVPDSRD
ncbi:MAG: hypothetical protein AB2661_20835, partial [Candidatus Thiodiazotropha sp.]